MNESRVTYSRFKPTRINIEYEMNEYKLFLESNLEKRFLTSLAKNTNH